MLFLRERSGRWSPEKIIAFIGSVLPMAWLAWRTWTNDLGPRPFDEATHVTGSWAVRFILLSLAVTPARRVFFAPKLIHMRRTLGVAAFGYALVHFSLYIGGEHADMWKVATEIVLRFYLTIGFIAFSGLVALAATSTDHAIKRLGGARWNRLHKAIYVIAGLAIVHFLLQTKLDISESIMMAGFLVWLLGYRLLHRLTGDVTPWHVLGLAAAATLLTAGGEAAWYSLGTGVDATRVLAVNLNIDFSDFDIGSLRPAAWVLLAGLVVAGVASVFRLRNLQKPRPRRSTPRAPSGVSQLQSGS
jgi:sulfoxide reductase heme-binding subunit YedZ